MLNKQQIDRSPEWLEADEQNRRNKPRQITKNFNAVWQGSRRMDLLTAPLSFLNNGSGSSQFYTLNSKRDLKLNDYSQMANQMLLSPIQKFMPCLKDSLAISCIRLFMSGQLNIFHQQQGRFMIHPRMMIL